MDILVSILALLFVSFFCVSAIYLNELRKRGIK